MISYPDGVDVGSQVIDTWASESLLVTGVTWRRGRGWEARTERPSGHSGPTFYPHPDRMPDPDPYVYSGDR